MMNISISKALSVLTKKIETWVLEFSYNLPNLIVSMLVLVGFYFAAKLVKNLVMRLFHRFGHQGPVAHLMSGVVQSFVIIAGIFVALGILNLDKTVSSLLAGAGVVGLAIGFAFQEIASNFIAGVLIAFRKPYRVGDILKVKDFQGRVRDINLSATIMDTFDGLEIIVPNKDMFTNILTNFTETPQRRVDMDIGVSYGEDLRRVKQIVLEALANVSGRLKDREPEVYFYEFADSSITFRSRLWIGHSDPRSVLMAQDEIVILVKEAFDKNDIMIPFPIRTLDFGIKGGKELSEVLRSSEEN